MTPDTLLLRQIHPSFIQEGRITSQAFRPTPKDEFKLSADNGDRIDAQLAWRRYVADPKCLSSGVQGISKRECDVQELPVIEDALTHPEHCSIDFTAFDRKVIEKKSKILRSQAEARGWLFQASRT